MEGSAIGKQSITAYTISAPSFPDMLINWIIISNIPYYMIENQYFRDMIRATNTKIKVPYRTTISQAITTPSVTIKNIIIDMLKQQKICESFDHWTSIQIVNFLSVTTHFIDNNWEMENICLCCQKHGGDSSIQGFKNELMHILNDYNLSVNDIVATVTDSTTNMNAAGIQLEFPYHYCVAHLLELTTGIAFNVKGGDGIMERARALVGHFQSSPRATELLMIHQSSAAKQLKVLSDSTTRWWSTFNMCKRLLS